MNWLTKDMRKGIIALVGHTSSGKSTLGDMIYNDNHRKSTKIILDPNRKRPEEYYHRGQEVVIVSDVEFNQMINDGEIGIQYKHLSLKGEPLTYAITVDSFKQAKEGLIPFILNMHGFDELKKENKHTKGIDMLPVMLHSSKIDMQARFEGRNSYLRSRGGESADLEDFLSLYMEQMKDLKSHLLDFPVIFSTDIDRRYLTSSSESAIELKRHEKIAHTYSRLKDALKFNITTIEKNIDYIDNLVESLTGHGVDAIRFESPKITQQGFNLYEKKAGFVEDFAEKHNLSLNYLKKILPSNLIDSYSHFGVVTLVLNQGDDYNAKQHRALVHGFFRSLLGHEQYSPVEDSFRGNIPQGLLTSYMNVNLIGTWGMRDNPAGSQRRVNNPIDKLVIATTNKSDTRRCEILEPYQDPSTPYTTNVIL